MAVTPRLSLVRTEQLLASAGLGVLGISLAAYSVVELGFSWFSLVAFFVGVGAGLLFGRDLAPKDLEELDHAERRRVGSWHDASLRALPWFACVLGSSLLLVYVFDGATIAWGGMLLGWSFAEIRSRNALTRWEGARGVRVAAEPRPFPALRPKEMYLVRQ